MDEFNESRPSCVTGANSFYDNYTTTSALAGLDAVHALRRNLSYFQANFARHLPSDRSAKILEIGCGYGKNLYALKQMGYMSVHGVDLSREQIEYAHAELGITEVALVDVFDWLPNSTQRFDCILLIDVLEHLDLAALANLAKLLKSHLEAGASVIIQVPNDLAPFNSIRCGDLTHMRAFTPQSMKQFFANAGLVVQAIHEALPPRNNVFDLARRALWMGAVRPLLSLVYMLVRTKPVFGLPFTENIIGVARKI